MKTTHSQTFKDGLERFLGNFAGARNGLVYLEDSLMWYSLDMGIDWYLSLPIHARINYKSSYWNTFYTSDYFC